MHLLHYVAATNELTLHVELRDSGPVGELLDSIAYLLIGQYVNIFPVIHTIELEDLSCIVAETASGHLFVPFHEEDDVVLRDQLGEVGVQLLLGHRTLLGLGLEISMALLSIIVVIVVVSSVKASQSYGLKRI